jgi:replication factor C subunit 1
MFIFFTYGLAHTFSGKLSRYVKEIQGHMRLKASGDRHEIRQQYLPALWNKTFKPLQAEGKEAVQGIIDFMDSYYLTRDDYDAIVELGVGPMDMEKQAKVETATKATFTRLYNSQSHPLPFMKASSIGAPIGGKSKKEKPDLEEAVDESEDEALGDEAVEVDDDEDGEIDLKKDKYIAKPKKKKAAAAKGKGKGKAEDDDADGDSEEPEAAKPTKKKAAGRGGRGGGRGRGK